MFVNIHNLINELMTLDKKFIPEHVQLCFESTGFSLKGLTNEESNELNRKYRLFLTNMNKIAGVEEMLTVTQIAKHLQMSPTTIYEILKNQDDSSPVLKYIQTEKGIRIKNSDYFEYLMKCYQNENNL